MVWQQDLTLICCCLKTICILICSVYVFALFQLTFPISDTCKNLGHHSTACVRIEGATGCKDHIYKEDILLEPCKQGCIAWAGMGTCVLAVHDKKDVGAEKGTCLFILKMNTPDVNLNVCKVPNRGSTTSRCTVGG